MMFKEDDDCEEEEEIGEDEAKYKNEEVEEEEGSIEFRSSQKGKTSSKRIETVSNFPKKNLG